MINFRNIFKLKIIPFLLFLFLSFIKVYGQKDSLRQIYTDINQSDSIRFNTLETEFYSTLYHSPDSLFENVEYHYALAVEKRDSSQIVESLMRTGLIYSLEDDVDKAIMFFDDAEEIAVAMNSKNLQIPILINQQHILFLNYRHLEAMRKIHKALKMTREIGDDRYENYIQQNIAVNYFTLEDYDKALEYYLQWKDGSKTREKNPRERGVQEMCIGLTYFRQNKFEEALPYYEAALVYFKKADAQDRISELYSYLSNLYNELHQLDKAEEFARRAIAISEKVEVIKAVAIHNKLSLAEITINKDVQSTLIALNDIKNQLPKQDFLAQYEMLYDLYYKGYKAQNNSEQAVKMLELRRTYQDSLAEKSNRLARVRELLNQEFEQELTEIKQSGDVEKAVIKTAQRKKMFALALLSLIMIIAISLYFRLKIKKNKAYRDSLLEEIEQLKINDFNTRSQTFAPNKFELDIEKIEFHIDKQLNETDKNILQTLLKDPVISNKQIADQVFLSTEGVSSALRRMYTYFNVKESKYKKISLLLEAVKLSNN